MAQDQTLTNLQDRALDYADMTSSAFPVTARLTDYLNAGYAELYEILIASYGADYVRSTSTTTLVAGTEAYSLPTDFYKMLRVFKVEGSNRFDVKRFTLEQLDGFKTTGPASAGSLSLWYVPHLTKLSTGSDVVHVSVCTGWEDFIALHAAIRLLQREQNDASQLTAERDRVRQRIIENASPRDQGDSDQVEDAYGRWNYGEKPQSLLRYRFLGNQLVVIELSEAA